MTEKLRRRVRVAVSTIVERSSISLRSTICGLISTQIVLRRTSN
jgi:hypothetical protein